MEYLLSAQLAEADLILLNKCDLIRREQAEADRAWLEQRCPQARVLSISALKGEGLDALSRILKQGKASMRRPDIGYGGAAFQAAMGKLSEYYLQYHAVVCCRTFDGNRYLMEMAKRGAVPDPCPGSRDPPPEAAGLGTGRGFRQGGSVGNRPSGGSFPPLCKRLHRRGRDPERQRRLSAGCPGFPAHRNGTGGSPAGISWNWPFSKKNASAWENKRYGNSQNPFRMPGVPAESARGSLPPGGRKDLSGKNLPGTRAFSGAGLAGKNGL